MRMQMVALGCAAAALVAGCATPSEVLEPPRSPAFIEPVETPDLPPYEPPTPHGGPQSDQDGTR